MSVKKGLFFSKIVAVIIFSYATVCRSSVCVRVRVSPAPPGVAEDIRRCDTARLTLTALQLHGSDFLGRASLARRGCVCAKWACAGWLRGACICSLAPEVLGSSPRMRHRRGRHGCPPVKEELRSARPHPFSIPAAAALRQETSVFVLSIS